MMLADRLRRALAGSTGQVLTDDRLSPGTTMTAAAVLVPITDRPEPGVLLTMRQPNLRRHAGQVAFPGGRSDPEDTDAIATALREAHEEIGLDPGAVDVVGLSDLYRTGSGFEVMPVVGVVPPDLPLVPQEAEVAAVFEVPLAFLLDRANHIRRVVDYRGTAHGYYEILWDEWRIWGVTAAMLVNLADRLEAFA